jgi:S1-C subfamily serine protease
VIGINSQIETGGSGGGNIGIGFAVPIDTAKQILPELKRDGRVNRGFLGIDALTVDRSLDDLHLAVREGALVQTVEPGSPADKAGIRGGSITAQLDGKRIELGGDVITAIDGKRVRSNEDVISIVTAKNQNDVVTIRLTRNGKERTVVATLGRRPVAIP